MDFASLDDQPNVLDTDLGDIEDDLLPVHKAAADGDIQSLVQIIQEDPSLLEQNSAEGVTPLGQAVLTQQLDVVKKLIKMGANIDAQDNVGRTCLSIAAYQGWHDGVVCLLRNGAKQSICDKSGRYPLHAATYHSDISTMSILLNGLTKKEINYPDHEMMTAVHWAAFHDRPEHLMQLLQKGGDVLARDVDGKLPLHWAAQNGSFQCTHRLISLTEGLAMVNDVDSSGKSPAHYAAAAGSANILKIIERCETVDLELEDPDERTPLHWAAAMGHAGAVETLLKLGVNPTPHDMDGHTPLDYAVQTGSRDCIKVLENIMGARSSALKEQKKYHISQENLQPNRKTSKQLEPGGVPTITVQAPTTTLSKATTNPGNMYPRMYSASTDTDAQIFHTDASASIDTPTTARQVSFNYKEATPGRSHEEKGALSKLVGASFMAGARAPILTDQPKLEKNHTSDVEAQHEEQKYSTKDNPSVTVLCADETNETMWASHVPATDTGTGNELHAMTSGNTPDIQRVSVQSFRSVPPIPPGSGGGGAVGRDVIDKTKGLCLQAARFTPLPSITPKRDDNQPSRESLDTDEPLTPRKTPLAPLRGPLRVLAEDHSPVTPRVSVPVVDFMTENNAETRILTKKYKNSLAKWHDIFKKHQASRETSNNVSQSSSYPNETVSTSISTSPTNKASFTQTRTHHGPKDSAVKFFKHSRIPSTRRVGGHQMEKSNQTAAFSEENGKPQDNLSSRRLQPPNPVRRGAYQTSTILSSAGMFRPMNDRYLSDDDDHAPPSPTPLANQTNTLLGDTVGGRRRVQQRLVGASETKATRKTAHGLGGGLLSHSQHSKLENNQEHAQLQTQQYPSPQSYTNNHKPRSEDMLGKNAASPEKKSVCFAAGTISCSRDSTQHRQIHRELKGASHQRGPSGDGRNLDKSGRTLPVAVLKPHGFARPKNDRSVRAAYN